VNDALTFAIRCVPPSVTAQQKRVSFVGGKPRFFHGAKMREQAATWSTLLQPFVPVAPITGAVELKVTMVYPHLKGTPKRDRHLVLPKITKPDSGNAAKHLVDLLSRLRFIDDDASVAREIVEKFHGPEASVGIQIAIRPMHAFPYAGVSDAQES
jgi:crossover junction endodeoxyribonuclease RusA